MTIYLARALNFVQQVPHELKQDMVAARTVNKPQLKTSEELGLEHLRVQLQALN